MMCCYLNVHFQGQRVNTKGELFTPVRNSICHILHFGSGLEIMKCTRVTVLHMRW